MARRVRSRGLGCRWRLASSPRASSCRDQDAACGTALAHATSRGRPCERSRARRGSGRCVPPLRLWRGARRTPLGLVPSAAPR
eukprot:1212063-Alexandrium_andersonii.AAC.1